jgi:hypothetical protein
MRKAAYLATLVVACTLPSFVSAGPPSLGARDTRDNNTAITWIAGGCGIGWHRGPYGGCRRNAAGVPPPGFYGPPGTPPRAVVGPRGGAIICPPGYHLGPQLSACWPN